MKTSHHHHLLGNTLWFTLLLYLLLLTTILPAQQQSREDFQRPLPIPPLLTGVRTNDEIVYELTARSGSRRFFRDVDTPTYGYNGDYLGPTLRFRRGEQVRIRVSNTLAEPTTVHWHGMEVPGDSDGGPHQSIPAGTIWEPHFTVDQPAATLWYHPHPIGNTARQVYLGLAGLIIIDDRFSDSLNLPKNYGRNDIPLVIQDRRFQADGTMSYRLNMPDLMHGLIGDTYLTNGAVKPYVSVESGLIRFRLLNGSNSSIYRFSFSDGSLFTQIASDGGFLEEPAVMRTLILSPGERAEIIVDLRSREIGSSLFLITETFQGFRDEVLKIVVQNRPSDPGQTAIRIPNRLTSTPKIPESQSVRSRRFDLETMSGGGMGMMGGGSARRLTINGRKMDMGRIDFKVRAGSTEVWEIVNVRTGMMEIPHSFHVHGVQFQILDINGESPPAGEDGWILHRDREAKGNLLRWYSKRHGEMAATVQLGLGNSAVDKPLYHQQQHV